MSRLAASLNQPHLAPAIVAQLETLAAELSAGQTLLVARWFLDRFDAAALTADRFELAASDSPKHQPGLTILYGTHSGHSASIANLVAARAKALGWSVQIANMADYPRGNLKRASHLAVVVSTHGEGQPPESAIPFFDFVLGERAPKLEHCAFSVLALGDKTYAQFCQAGRDLDARLASLGASRLLERVDLDLDYEDGAAVWVEQLISTLSPRMKLGAPAAGPTQSRPKSRIDRDNPWTSTLLERVILSGRGSTQCYAHLEFSLENANLKYEPGDAAGIRPENDPALVTQLVEALGAKHDTPVALADAPCSLADALGRRVEIGHVSPSALRKYRQLGAKGLADLVSSPEATQAYVRGRDWLDVLREHPIGLGANEFVALLPELASRSYSIASSQSVHPDDVHLLVSQVSYDAHGRRRAGAASSYLVQRLEAGHSLPLWIEPNCHFRLPTDPNVPIVLVGAGTGIAPYRAFLEARADAGAPGRNWVIFGNRQFRSDFTYQAEWLKWREQGVLTRMDIAFSRDGSRKRYVTDELRSRGAELYAWLEQGAWLYLCGDRAKLSTATDQALIDVVATHGGRTLDQASNYVAQLTANHRYIKDVY